MKRPSDPHRALEGALLTMLAPATLTASTDKPWGSVTFSGARHRFQLALTGDGAAATANRFAQSLTDQDFDIPGHLVADISVRATSSTPSQADIRVEALTVEAA
jgi:hypothetical protein